MKNDQAILFFLIIFLAIGIVSCGGKTDTKEQELTLNEVESMGSDSARSGLNNGSSFNQINTAPNEILLTGIDRVRLFTLYKIKQGQDRNILYDEGTSYYEHPENDQEDFHKYFMPGIDIIHGYNLVNIGHYNLDKDTLTYFFEKPVLIKTLYFPGVKKDTVNGKAITRNYFLVSVYNEDTNRDSTINNRDMRRFYFFDELNSKKTSLLPENFSAIRSSYDYKNDIMFIHARADLNGNGTPETKEPVSIFWIKLENPTIIKKII